MHCGACLDELVRSQCLIPHWILFIRSKGIRDNILEQNRVGLFIITGINWYWHAARSVFNVAWFMSGSLVSPLRGTLFCHIEWLWSSLKACVHGDWPSRVPRAALLLVSPVMDHTPPLPTWLPSRMVLTTDIAFTMTANDSNQFLSNARHLWIIWLL